MVGGVGGISPHRGRVSVRVSDLNGVGDRDSTGDGYREREVEDVLVCTKSERRRGG